MRMPRLMLVAAFVAWSGGSLVAAEIPGSFTAIASRNAFGLNPPQPLAIKTPEPPNRPKVAFQGITTILGRTLALLTIEPASKSAAVPQTSWVLAQGESRFDVIVLAIDVETGTVRLNNLGAEQTLTLKR